jgi:hypothetical protein
MIPERILISKERTDQLLPRLEGQKNIPLDEEEK